MKNDQGYIFFQMLYCLVVTLLIEVVSMQTGWFGKNVILWNIFLRTIAVVPVLWYFYQKDRGLRGEVRWNWKYAIGFLVAGAAASAGFRFLFMWMNVPGYEVAEQNLMVGNLLLQTLVLVVASPLSEEFFFRGVLYRMLKEIASVPMAIVLSALVFGLYHGNLSQGIYGFIMGVFLAWAMEHCRTLKAPLLIHMAANMAAIWLNLKQ